MRPPEGAAVIILFLKFEKNKENKKIPLSFLTKGSRLGQGAVCLAPPPSSTTGEGRCHNESLSGVGEPKTANHQLAAISDAEQQNKNPSHRPARRGGSHHCFVLRPP